MSAPDAKKARSEDGLPAKPLPHPDRDSAPFWAAARAGELRLQRCDGCGAWRFPPRAICERCGSFASTWTRTSGRGRVTTWITTHRPFSAAFRDEVPYHVIAVALEEQAECVLLGNLLGGGEPSAGLRVRAVFVPVSDSAALVQWQPDEPEGPTRRAGG